MKDVKFYLEKNEYNYYFTNNYISHVFFKIDSIQIDSAYRVDMMFDEANSSTATGGDRNESTSNFYYPHCSDGLSANSFENIRYPNIFNSIDLTIANKSSVSLLYNINPHGNPNSIKFHFDGATQTYIDIDGNLIATTQLGIIKYLKPTAYQEIDNTVTEITCEYRISNSIISLAFDNYNSAYSLKSLMSASSVLIVPSHPYNNNWTTFYGKGSGSTFINDVYYDDSPNDPNVIYITGKSSATIDISMPGALYYNIAGNSDAFIAKFNSMRGRVWATYYGGTEEDNGTSITRYKWSVSPPSNYSGVYITGTTVSGNFPLCNTCSGYFDGAINTVGGHDLFLVELEAASGLRNTINFNGMATFFGGDQSEQFPIVVGYRNGIYLGGTLYSSGSLSLNFPFKSKTNAYNQLPASNNGNYVNESEVFISKFDNNNGLTWCTAFGGATDQYTWAAGEGLSSMYVDNVDDLYISGSSSSMSQTYNAPLIGNPNTNLFPVCHPFTPTGTNPYVHDHYPVYTSPMYTMDAFIAKFFQLGSLVWSTLIGGRYNDNPSTYISGAAHYAQNKRNIVVDSYQNIYFTGSTYSDNFPYFVPSGNSNVYNQNALRGLVDSYIMKFNHYYELTYSTYLGGFPNSNNGSTGNDFSTGITANNIGEVAIVGLTDSYNFPVINNPNGGYYDNAPILSGGKGFIFKMSSNLERQFCTYFGGGNSLTWPQSIGFSRNGEHLVLGGYSNSSASTFPLHNMPGTLDYFSNVASNAIHGFLADLYYDNGCPLCKILDNKINSTLDVFPTLTNGHVYNKYQSEDKTDIKIYNNIGALISEKIMDKLNPDQEIFDFSNYSNGLYFITFNSNANGYVAKKIVKNE